jgi:hypothetical protein
MSKNNTKEVEYSYSEDSFTGSSDYTDSEEEREIRKKFIPASQRLKEAIKQRQEDRKKGTKKEKVNYDE